MKCTLKDDKLILKVKQLNTKLTNTRGQSWCLTIPPDMNNDPDVLLDEIANRFEKVLNEKEQMYEALMKIYTLDIPMDINTSQHAIIVKLREIAEKAAKIHRA